MRKTLVAICSRIRPIVLKMIGTGLEGGASGSLCSGLEGLSEPPESATAWENPAAEGRTAVAPWPLAPPGRAGGVGGPTWPTDAVWFWAALIKRVTPGSRGSSVTRLTGAAGVAETAGGVG